MKTNAEITRTVLSVRQANSLLNLQAKAERSGGYVRISPAQLNAMQIAWNAVRAGRQPHPARSVPPSCRDWFEITLSPQGLLTYPPTLVIINP